MAYGGLFRAFRAVGAHRFPRFSVLCRACRRHRRFFCHSSFGTPFSRLPDLLLTFCAFFVFSGNLARIPAVESALGSLVALSPLLVGTASCQVISNVPSAVLLSRFTSDYRHLLVAVNIGGLGTPVASLASLITLGEYRRRCPGSTARYLGLFSLINFGYLAVLIASSYLADVIIP